MTNIIFEKLKPFLWDQQQEKDAILATSIQHSVFLARWIRQENEIKDVQLEVNK